MHHSLTILPSLTSSLLHLRERLSRCCFFHLSWLFLLLTSLLRRLDRLDYSISTLSLLFLPDIVSIRFLRFLGCFCFRLVSSSSRSIEFSPGDHLQLSLLQFRVSVYNLLSSSPRVSLPSIVSSAGSHWLNTVHSIFFVCFCLHFVYPPSAPLRLSSDNRSQFFIVRLHFFIVRNGSIFFQRSISTLSSSTVSLL